MYRARSKITQLLIPVVNTVFILYSCVFIRQHLFNPVTLMHRYEQDEILRQD